MRPCSRWWTCASPSGRGRSPRSCATAFNFCTFWLIEALHLSGRAEEARKLFDEMLSRRTAAGLLSEDITLTGDELWGNYPQTYSLVGLINCANLLSRPWTSVR